MEERLRLCRLLCGRALPFRRIGISLAASPPRLSLKFSQAGPKSRRLSAQRAAKPQNRVVTLPFSFLTLTFISLRLSASVAAFCSNHVLRIIIAADLDTQQSGSPLKAK